MTGEGSVEVPRSVCTDDDMPAPDEVRAKRRRRKRPSDDPQARMGSWSAALAGVIEGEIIPRLLIANRDLSEPPWQGSAEIGPNDIETFTRITITRPPSDSIAFARAILERGLTLDAVMIELLGPAARLVGEQWERDEVSFVDVTIAVSRMQQVVRELSPPNHAPFQSNNPRAAFLLPSIGEDHSFGLLVVGEIFQRAGWSVSGCLPVTLGELSEAVSCRSYAVVGFSISRDALIDRLASDIKLVRSVSRNPDVVVIVGGRLALENQALSSRVGADAAFADPRQAIVFADSVYEKTIGGMGRV